MNPRADSTMSAFAVGEHQSPCTPEKHSTCRAGQYRKTLPFRLSSPGFWYKSWYKVTTSTDQRQTGDSCQSVCRNNRSHVMCSECRLTHSGQVSWYSRESCPGKQSQRMARESGEVSTGVYIALMHRCHQICSAFSILPQCFPHSPAFAGCVLTRWAKSQESTH